jgi:hypothetical protein
MIRTGVILSFLLVIITFTLGCFYTVRYDGPYRGKVIDAETLEPLEGVVVLGVWYKEYPTPAGAVHKFYDAKETVTDKNGEFSILGLGLRIMTNVVPMHVMIFKAGYESEGGGGSWDSLKTGYLASKKIKWEGSKAIIPLRKLTMEERKKRGTPSTPSIPEDKMKQINKEINKERIEIGLKPIELGD